MIRIFMLALMIGSISVASLGVSLAQESGTAGRGIPAWIRDIENYMDRATTLKADFTQENPNKTVWKGVVYIKRPAKFRMEYSDPEGVMFISSGNFLFFVDSIKKRMDQFFVAGTPLALLTRKKFRVDDDKVSLIGYKREDTYDYVRIAARKNPEAGSVVLFFGRDPVELLQWIIVDSQNNQTLVRLYNHESGGSYPDKMFVFVAPSDWRSNR